MKKDSEPRVACRAEFNGKGSCRWGLSCRFAHTDAELNLTADALKLARRKTTPGFVFLCDNKTRAEVLKLKLFGLPSRNLDEMKLIDAETDLFLWDFKDCELLGPFKTDGPPRLNIDASAFQGRFPAQLKFKGTPKVGSASKKRYRVGPLNAGDTDAALALLEEDPPQVVTPPKPNSPPSRRRQSVEDLQDDAAPGWMYVVNNDSQSEVLRKRIIAVRESRLDVLQARISPDTSIFLYNHNTRNLLGVFKRRGKPALDIVPDAFRGRFRAQLKVALTSKALLYCHDDKQYDGGPLTTAEVQTLSEALHRPPSADP